MESKLLFVIKIAYEEAVYVAARGRVFKEKVKSRYIITGAVLAYGKLLGYSNERMKNDVAELCKSFKLVKLEKEFVC